MGSFLSLTELLLGHVLCASPNKVSILQSDEDTDAFTNIICTMCLTKACLEQKGRDEPSLP